MSEFATLMLELKLLLPERTRIWCSVEVGAFMPKEKANEALPRAWQARIEWPEDGANWGGEGFGPPILVRYGPSGEAALRNLVEAVKAGHCE